MSHNAHRITAQRLSAWFHEQRRALPWRHGTAAGPVAETVARDRGYALLVIETMAQQTRLETVLQRLPDFFARFPTLITLAQSPVTAVLSSWAGLGYYRRARNLHAAAHTIAAQGGQWPQTEAGWRALPGVGSYTAAALAAQVNGLALPAIDGNVQRVGARLLGIAQPAPRALRQALVERFDLHGGIDLCGAQRSEALIELGALICTPRQPKCPACPLNGDCVTFAEGLSERIPAARTRSRMQDLQLHAHVYVDAHGRLALEQRPESGLWAGTWGLPWRATPPADAPLIGRFQHLLSHRRIEATVWRSPNPPCTPALAWRALSEAHDLPQIDARALAMLGAQPQGSAE